MTEQVATVTSGDTYVDVVHGASSTPTLDQLVVIPHDNLNGKSWWVDNIGAVNFRINISAQDAPNAHEFGWRLAFETYSPAAGRYGVLNTVKNLCQITLTETSFDTQLDNAIKAADNIINNALERAGATVPIASPDDIIHDISNYLAAGLYKQKDVPDEKQHSFYTIGLQLLNEYILTNYPGATPVVSGGSGAPTTNQSIAYNVGLAT